MEQIYEGLRLLLDTPLAAVTEGTVEDLVTRLDAVTRIGKLAAEMQDALALALADQVNDESMAIPGVGLLNRVPKGGTRVRRGGTAKLRQDLPIAVARKVGVDPYTGEINADRRDGAADAVREVIATCGITASSLKVSARELIGLDPDDYVQANTGHKFVILPVEEQA
jgi:hypothetical protein